MNMNMNMIIENHSDNGLNMIQAGDNALKRMKDNNHHNDNGAGDLGGMLMIMIW